LTDDSKPTLESTNLDFDEEEEETFDTTLEAPAEEATEETVEETNTEEQVTPDNL